MKITDLEALTQLNNWRRDGKTEHEILYDIAAFKRKKEDAKNQPVFIDNWKNTTDIVIKPQLLITASLCDFLTSAYLYKDNDFCTILIKRHTYFHYI